MRMIKWPSIEQFRNAVKNVQHTSRYKGTDANGEAMFDVNAKLPTLKFEGTVKLHGTNASVVVNSTEVWFQSRENIITPAQDNAGFAMFAHALQDVWRDIASRVINLFPDEYTTDKDIAIFGEWCGGNIQKGVAISGLPKMFVIFGIALVDAEGVKTYLYDHHIQECIAGHTGKETRVFYIHNFQSFEVDIDFENPHHIQNELNKLTEYVEQQCPVGYSFGNDGVSEGRTTDSTIGEGIVWRCIAPGWNDSGFWFKVKGSEHSKSKVKTLATVDVERIDNIKQLCDTLAHDGRLEQIYQQTFNTLNGGEPDIKRTGEYIKAVMADILKEELDTIAASGFTTKDITGAISNTARNYLLKQLEL